MYNGTVEDGWDRSFDSWCYAGATREKGGFKNVPWSVKHVDDYSYIRLDANSTQIRVDLCAQTVTGMQVEVGTQSRYRAGSE